MPALIVSSEPAQTPDSVAPLARIAALLEFLNKDNIAVKVYEDSEHSLEDPLAGWPTLPGYCCPKISTHNIVIHSKKWQQLQACTRTAAHKKGAGGFSGPPFLSQALFCYYLFTPVSGRDDQRPAKGLRRTRLILPGIMLF